jgi:isocitrate/isopropylmalate dehydrogenase
MMLEHVGEIASAARLRRALELALTEKTMRTPDLGGESSTERFADAVIARL